LLLYVKDHVAREANLLYTAQTKAMERLFLFHHWFADVSPKSATHSRKVMPGVTHRKQIDQRSGA
jgi:hypothetical protein